MSRDEAKVWDRFSGIYDTFIRKDMPAYRQVIGLILQRVAPFSRVLEIATGTGILALGIAGSTQHVEAVDLSPEMVVAAQKKARRLGISNVRFSVQNAYALPYDAGSFDVVIIANTLHIMPQPERALAEIKRVLSPEGVLIAPCFVHSQNKKAELLSKVMSLSGFKAYHKWTEQSYEEFLSENEFVIVEKTLLQASFPMIYVAGRIKEAVI